MNALSPRLHPLWSVVILLGGLLVLFPTTGRTEEEAPLPTAPAASRIFHVQTPGLSEEFEISLRAGRKGVIEVVLLSTGDPLEGYKIELYDVVQKKSLKIVDSTVDGLLRFRGLPPGKYRVYLRKDPVLHIASSVNIADLKLKEE